jgi:hypothetical protein
MQRNSRTTRSTRFLWSIACACLACCACNRDETPASSPKSASLTATAPAAAVPLGADAQDDPQAPRSLPDTNDLPGWIKSEPIHRVQPDQLPMARRNPAVADALRAFPIDRAWACAYSLNHVSVALTLVETSDPLDAFGLFSVFTRQPGIGVRSPDRTFLEHARTAGGATVAGWQGKVYMQLEASGFKNADEGKPVDDLARKILFSSPAADTPLIMRAIPRKMMLNGKVWMVRRTAVLGTTLDELKRIATAGLDATLGLTGHEKCWLAAVEKQPETQTADRAPSERVSTKHLIWIVEYTNEDDARTAHARYRQRLSSPATELDRDTRVCEPQGPYLAGTWTAGTETTAPLLPDLVEGLPAATDKAASHPTGGRATRPASAPQ